MKHKFAPLNGDVSDVSDVALRRLRKINFALALFHTLQFALIFALTNAAATMGVYTYFPSNSSSARDGVTDACFAESRPNACVTPRFVSNSVIGYEAGVFLLLAALNHALCAWPLNGFYENCLKKSCNVIRWAEYALSAGIMHVMVAQLCGVTDILLLLAVFALTATTMGYGLLQEALNGSESAATSYRATDKNWWPFALGCATFLFVWVIILVSFAGVSGDAPSFVWGILFTEVVLDSLFALNTALSTAEVGPWQHYTTTETMFCILSFGAKSALAWINFGGSVNL